jgi:hypothetical protein
MTKPKKGEMIFLYDKNILPWRTPDQEIGGDPGKVSVSGLKFYRASTKPKEFHGPAVIKTIAGPYIVSASAMVYTADIARIVEGDDKFAGDKYKPEEEILFVGAIQIIDGRGAVADDWMLNARIWHAKKMPKTNVLETGLQAIILNNELKNERKTAMLDMIVRGYESQAKEEEELERHQQKVSRSYRRTRWR